MIAVIDYGMGNLRSVEKAFQYIGFDAVITDDPAAIAEADKAVLPGVGAFADAMSTLIDRGLDKAIYSFINSGKPFLGICLGLQLLMDTSYESGVYKGLGIFKGTVEHIPPGLKVPHMGWNDLEHKEDALFNGLSRHPYVYFVHSYYVNPIDASIVTATAHYGIDMPVAVHKDNIFAVQFHPEKSSSVGLNILRNFGRLEV
ncbi:imidazole glycerol phosphate synthase subunit HisH [Mahella australiensis]|uniref:Imidazole glycerol phosphate synthase subunit HisH n=1 Tax=Mahella australiensis (strain DSM 15567 / CIP 107919 / 50-1 BON) TaxID=697281 RepID=F3ZX35_MAHA5|nr:imidazole glycerol phosphate synthase subunit HisH [Mahella australiensis]AEE95484.1 imidazole glycerol phosphate synthase subunit hisH [Mahella australiensis 50-1 BON]